MVAIEEYLATKSPTWTHDSYHWYQKMLGSFLRWCESNNLIDLSQITAVQVQAFVAAEPQLADNTKHHRAQVVKGFLRWCVDDPDFGVKERTVKRIEMPVVEQSEISIFSDEEIQRLLSACDHTRHKLRNRALLLLLLDTGIRLSEACYDGDRPEETTGLLLDHVILGKRGAESYVIVMGKGRKSRTIKIGDETRLSVQKYINHERGRSEHPHLFLAQGNTPLNVRTVDQLLKNLGKQARVVNTHAHRFRHTFAIHQLMAGTSALVLMQLLGHTTLEATKVYTRALTQMQTRQASVSVVDVMRGKRKH